MWKYKSKIGVLGRSSWTGSIMRPASSLTADITALMKLDFKSHYCALGWPVQKEIYQKKHKQTNQKRKKP